jgi:hypothetical protein
MGSDVAVAQQKHVLVKDKIFDHIDYVPHAAQVDIHRSPARMKVVAAGRRLGKSEIGGHELTVEGMATYGREEELKRKGQRREFWIVGPEYSDSEKEFRKCWNDLVRLEVPMDRPGSYNNPHNGDLSISLWNGTFQVHGKSAKYPETLVGEGLSGVIMAEAAKVKERVWTKFIRPTLADFKGWALMTSTPEGKNWFYEAWVRGQDANSPSWASWRRPSWENPSVFPEGATPLAIDLLLRMMEPMNIIDKQITVAMIREAGMDPEILDMAADMSAEKFKQEIAADFTEFVGRVFKGFDEEVHVTNLQYDPAQPLYACCDYGWTHPFVWLFVQVTRHDQVNVLAEYRVERRDINDIAADLVQIPLTKYVQVFYPDPAEPGDTAVLESKLQISSNPDTGGELKHRLEFIRQGLKMNFGNLRPNLLIDRSCTGLIHEMNEYRWPETKEESDKMPSEKPMDKDDHGPEALGRFYRGYYGAPGSDGGRAVTRIRNADLT